MLPLMVARPATIETKSSARVSVPSQGRISSGASTIPTKTLAATERLQAPDRPNSRRKPPASPFTTSGMIRQWYSTADSAPTSSTSGSAWKNRMKLPPGATSANGSGPPPR